MKGCVRVGLFLVFLYQSAFSEAQEFKFQDTLKFAIEHAASLNSFQKELEISDLELKNAFYSFLPTFDLTTSYGLQKPGFQAPLSNSSPWASDLNLNLSEKLYDNGESLILYKVAKLKKENAELIFRSERDRLCLLVASEYFKYSLNKKLYDVQKKQYELISEEFRIVENQYHLGMKTEKDYLRFKTNISRSRLDILEAENNILRSELELKRDIGLQSQFPASFQPIEETSFKNLEEIPLSFQKTENNLVYKSILLQESINESAAELSRKKYRPEVSLTAGYSFQNSGFLGNPSSFMSSALGNANIMLTLKYNLLDWGTRGRQSEIAFIKNEIQSNELTTKKLGLDAEINQLLLDLKQLKENYLLSVELLRLEEISYHALQSDYRQGKFSYLDLATGIKDFVDAQVKLYHTAFDLKTALMKYHFYNGTLYETIFPK